LNWHPESGGRSEASVLSHVARALTRVVSDSELILIALSGGPDSVALLHALIALRDRSHGPSIRIAAAHFNHRIRGAEADRDEAFVRELCAQLGVELIVEQAAGLAAGSPNLEERARFARYAFLERTAERLGAAHIAIAHHADDQAETVLMRLLRGSGVLGLGAMAEAGPGRLIRPLLNLTRAEILDYLNEIGAGFVTDSSNQSTALARNFVRHELIPMLERDYSPGLRRRLAELASESRELNDFTLTLAAEECIGRMSAEGRFDLTGFNALHPALQSALIREFIRVGVGDLRRFERAHIEAIRGLFAGATPNGELNLPRGWRMRREYDSAVLEPGHVRPEASDYRIVLPIGGEVEVAPAGMAFSSHIEAVRGASSASSGMSSVCNRWRAANKMEAGFDAAKIGSMSVRNRRNGDRIALAGGKGTRKLQDVFIDNKIARTERDRWPIVLSDDEVAWVPGLTRGGLALVTLQTQKVLYLRAYPIGIEGDPTLLPK
jgi:tRNA(Ile)-lysidine synthase